MSRTGPKNPHRSGLAREPRMFDRLDTPVSMSQPAPDDLSYDLQANARASVRAKMEALSARNREADAAYDEALAPARLPMGHPDRKTYVECLPAALAAFDEVVARWSA